MRNKVLKFSFCPLGSNRGRKMTFSRVVLSLKLHQHFKKKANDILGDDWPCPSRCAIRFRNFLFTPRGQMRDEKRLFLFSVNFVTWTTSTLSEVDNWYSRIWLGMSCGWPVGIRTLHFMPSGHIVWWKDDVFCRIRLVTWTPFEFQIVDKWYSRIFLVDVQ